ncbi:MAG: type II toxin-antitoxin system Phd/YefM family antitoxin [bacterium]|nr:type II toxin-antitoxin system Phd/YefM family antitoxin [bacterium]
MDRVSIVEAKRDLSRVINRAAYGHEPVILTSRGRPKAVLIGHEEFLRLAGSEHRNIVRLGGLWKDTPSVSARELRAVRAQVWRKLAGR